MNRQIVKQDLQNNGASRLGPLLRAAQQAIMSLIYYVPKFEALTLSFALGIALYFIIPFEPWLWLCLGFVLIAYTVYRVLQHLKLPLAGLILCCVMIALGLCRARHHSLNVAAPILPQFERSHVVTGWIYAIDRSGKGLRYYIKTETLSGLKAFETPKAVRIRLPKPPETDIRAGDRVRIKAILKAPPGPVVPKGYDPARRAFFQGLGGYGFAIGAPEKHTDFDLPLLQRLNRQIIRWRYGLARHIYQQSPPRSAGLQAALMTGVRRYIPPEQIEDLRIAGLAHILAISGLHMGLLAGGSYAAMTLILVLILPLSRRYDVRKFAAIIGAISAASYLLLSGASVATQRAFIMAIIVFLALILDRRALSMRSVAVAAMVTLILHPESLVSVGFQMSFAAVAALVATYQIWQNHRPGFYAVNWPHKIRNFFTSLSVTSFIAGLATAGFAMFHFNRISRYGFMGNLLAMPLFSLIVMPLAVVSFIAMPSGLELWPLRLMGAAIEYILITANWVTTWPNAMHYIHAAPRSIFGLFTLGFVVLCFGVNKARILGGVLIGLSYAAWSQTPLPDLRISEQGRIAFWLGGKTQSPILMVNRRRSDRYGREQFAQMAGRPDSVWVDYEKSFADCDALACRFVLRGKTISVMKHPSEVIGECAQVDLAILTERAAGPVARRLCQRQGRALLLDSKTLRQSGAVNIYLEPLHVEPSRKSSRARRPWGGGALR